MIQLDLRQVPNQLRTGMLRLSERLACTDQEDGVAIHVVQRPGDIEVTYDTHHATIHYDKTIHFFRA
jgi:hypothetical protein